MLEHVRVWKVIKRPNKPSGWSWTCPRVWGICYVVCSFKHSVSLEAAAVKQHLLFSSSTCWADDVHPRELHMAPYY